MIKRVARNQDEAKVVNQMAKGYLNQAKTFLQVQASKNPDFKPAVEAVERTLRNYPPLVFAGEARRLKASSSSAAAAKQTISP